MMQHAQIKELSMDPQATVAVNAGLLFAMLEQVNNYHTNGHHAGTRAVLGAIHDEIYATATIPAPGNPAPACTVCGSYGICQAWCSVHPTPTYHTLKQPCSRCGKPTVMSDRGGLDYWCNTCNLQTPPARPRTTSTCHNATAKSAAPHAPWASLTPQLPLKPAI